MAGKKTQNYEIVYNLIARGGQQLISQIQTLAKLTKSIGKDDLSNKYSTSFNKINEIIRNFTSGAYNAKQTVNALNKEFENIANVAKNSDIFVNYKL